MSDPVAAPALMPLDFSLRPAAARLTVAPPPARREARGFGDDRWTPTAQADQPVSARRPARGPTIGTDLGDGWRLEGSASFKGKGTLRATLRTTF